MPSGIAMRAREVVKQPHPAITRGPRTTSTAAFNDYNFVANLQAWDTFEVEVLKRYDSTEWNKYKTTLSYRGATRGTPSSLVQDQVVCGNETGVQGRFQAHLGEPMSAVCDASGLDLVFGDYAATVDQLAGEKIRDMAIIRKDGTTRAYGEVKVSWIT
ncbi:hypothetical protein BJX64DRAFT_294780 [Aspergillus heterothallicus]